MADRPPQPAEPGGSGRTTLSRRTGLLAAGSALSTALAGCLGIRQGVSQATASVELVPLWTGDRSTEYGGNHHQFAALDGLTVVAPHSSLTGNADCGITALDSGGDSAWYSPITPENCTPHAVGDIGVGERGDGLEVFTSTEAGEVLGFDPLSGDPTLAVDALDSIGYTAPVAGDFTGPNQVVAADFEGLIVALDSNEDVVWNHDLDTRISVNPILSDLTGNGESMLAVAHGRRSDSGVSVFGADGNRRWTESVGATPRSFTMVDAGAVDDDGSSDEDNNQLLAVGTRETAVCIEATGETRWTASFGEVVSVGDSLDGRLLVAANDGVLRALSVDDGSVDWEQPLLTGDEKRLNAPAVGDPRGDGPATIAMSTYTGGVFLLDTAGSVLASLSLDNPSYVAPVFADLTGDGSDDLVVMDGHGRLSAFAVDTE